MTLATGDLTTVSRVKQWLGIADSDTGSDSLLASLITSASRFVFGHISLTSVIVQEYEENYDGYGQNFMLLKKWPALSIASINFCGLSITAEATGNPRTNGYFLSPADDINMGPQRLRLFGYCFPKGRNLVDITYTAGFGQYDEAATVPATPFQVTTAKSWASNIAVTYANGDAMTEVASAPTVGQYSVSSTGVYTFAAADEGEAVLISYSYVPADLEQVVTELVAEAVRYKDRIGVKSKTLGGQETIVYDNLFKTDRIQALLGPFTRVAPI